MKGSFAPVHKEVLEEVEVVEGQLPADLAGAFVRTGELAGGCAPEVLRVGMLRC